MPTSPETFNAICELAKAQNQFGLQRVIDDAMVSIDIYSGLYTPIMRLAEGGEHNAVAFLWRHFDANLNSAVEGYAREGFHKQVDALLAKGAHIGFAVRGYASIGDENRVILYMTGQPLDVVRPCAIAGYALGGFIDNVNALLTLTEGKWSYLAAIGYGAGNHHNAVIPHDLWKPLVAPTENVWNPAIEKVKTIFNIPMEMETDMRAYFLQGYAMRGNFSKVEELIGQGVEHYRAILGYALGNHGKDILAWENAKQHEADTAIMAYIHSGNIGKVSALTAREHHSCRNEDYSTVLQRIVDAYKSSGHINSLRKLSRVMVLMENARLRYSLSSESTNETNAVVLKKAMVTRRLITEAQLNISLVILLDPLLFYVIECYAKSREVFPHVIFINIMTQLTGFSPWLIKELCRQVFQVQSEKKLQIRQYFNEQSVPQEPTITEGALTRRLEQYEVTTRSSSDASLFKRVSSMFVSPPAISNTAIVLANLRGLLTQDASKRIAYSRIQAAIAPIRNDEKIPSPMSALIENIRGEFCYQQQRDQRGFSDSAYNDERQAVVFRR